MLSQKDLAIARAHAENQQDDLVLDLLDHIQTLQKMVDQARPAPKPAPGKPKAVPGQPKRPNWYPKEPRIVARKP